ncbi:MULTISPECIES: phage portal protein [Providencia]|uniref:phage portal protein n=1 Tax=Providencia TaxID=586 RepID=UPI001B396028|nr:MULTISPECIES: phage portal protein [Providencia]MBQ0314311.1 phage portal protein [Providencia rettgeri]MBQ0323876.1 phage portal protein [Providencia rettgeri]MBQ0349496.1 phage portal protein [Providencia rettgeri]
MNIIDKAISMISPGWASGRLRARLQIQAYEAVIPSRLHKGRRERRNANQLTQLGGQSLREQARWLDNNHDLVIGILDKMEERVVGGKGIIVEPQPLSKTGKIHDELASQIRTAWAEWSIRPDVTGQYTRPMLERLLVRTWLRDGEVFAQLVKGNQKGLEKQAGIPFWLEALEPDFVPINLNDTDKHIQQGIVLNEWGRPIAYKVYKNLQTSGQQLGGLKSIKAENMLHLKYVRRLHQLRGNSLFTGILMRLSALKDYEDAELTAARIAASLGMYIKKGDGQEYSNQSGEDDRGEMTIVPGMLFNELLPGEDIGMIKSDRPNQNLETFRNGQLRAVAAGSRGSYSSIARDYNGSYSSQRQELVESFEGYYILQDTFCGSVCRPNYRQWLQMAIVSGVITVPPDVELISLYNATYSGPVMPWIDPQRESNAWKTQIRGGAATESDWVRARGGNPAEVKRRRKAEIDENERLGLKFDTDPANDKGNDNADEKHTSHATKKQHDDE